MKTLARKIAEVVQAVKHPPQSGRHQFLKFDYSTRDDIFGAIRGELANRGVAVFPSVECIGREACGQSRNGNTQYRIHVRVDVLLVEGETGESLTQRWDGEAITGEDKGIQGASTQALRFWATNTFMLLDGSDEQMHGQPGTQTVENVNRQAAAPTPADARQAIRKRLEGLDFAAAQVDAFEGYISGLEKAGDIGQVHPGKLKLWADRMSKAGDEDVRSKVMDAIRSQKEAA